MSYIESQQSGGWEEEVRSQSVNRGMGQNQQSWLTFLNACKNFDSTSRWLSKKEQLTTRSHHIWLTHGHSGLLPTTNPKAANTSSLQTTNQSQNCPYPAPFIYSQCKFFQKSLHLSSPGSSIRKVHQPQDGGHVCLFHLSLVV